MVFLWRGAVFRLADIVSDLSFDRGAVLNKVNAKLLELRDAVLASPDTGTWEGLATRLKNFAGFDTPKLPKFFEFIRSPYLAVSRRTPQPPPPTGLPASMPISSPEPRASASASSSHCSNGFISFADRRTPTHRHFC